MSERFRELYKFLQRNWNFLAALMSIAGVLICSLVTAFQTYIPAFAFLGVNAVVWTLIEIKTLLYHLPTKRRYENMRHARADIVKQMTAAMC
jgi:hypothetical protein